MDTDIPFVTQRFPKEAQRFSEFKKQTNAAFKAQDHKAVRNYPTYFVVLYQRYNLFFFVHLRASFGNLWVTTLKVNTNMHLR